MKTSFRPVVFPNYLERLSLLDVDLPKGSLGRHTVVWSRLLSDEPYLPPPPSIQLPPLPKIENLNAVPEELHEDPLFRDNIDPISSEPILDPVADRSEPKHIYERATILKWLKVKQTSPLTRRPMTEAGLVPVPKLKAEIDEKIRENSLKKQEGLLKEATLRYQKELTHYQTVEVPKFKDRVLSLPVQQRAVMYARGVWKILGDSFNRHVSGLKREVSLLLNPIAGLVDRVVRGALVMPERDQALNPSVKL